MKIKSIINYIIIFFLLAITTGLFLNECNKVEENPVSISSIDLYPPSINLGGFVTVTINASDEEDRTLNYAFSANGGTYQTITDSTLNTATWVAPATGGTYTITGRAYAGDDEDTASRDITVVDIENKPSITLVYPTEGISIPEVNHPDFSFNAYHSNGVHASEGLIIDFYEDSTLLSGIISNVVQSNPSGDDRNFTFTFDINLNDVSGDCYLELGVQSVSGVDSDTVQVNITVEAVTQDY